MVSCVRAIAITLLSLILAISVSLHNMPIASATLPFENGKIKVNVYVVALKGVGASCIDNVSEVVAGADEAVKWVPPWMNETIYGVKCPVTNGKYAYYMNVSKYLRYAGGGGSSWLWLQTNFPLNVSLHLVSNWETYRSIIENPRECVVINCHGEIVPVPEGFSKEEWVDKIAFAMLHYNLSWVHVGGYPFYYVCHQYAPSKEFWGQDGFKQLMRHIGKESVIIPTPTTPKGEMAWLSTPAEQTLKDTWSPIYEAIGVSIDYPLLYQDFKEHIAMPIWNMSAYQVGTVIAFKNQLNTTSHGFYIHIGTNQTYDIWLNPTERDMWCGFMGCIGGLWSLISRTARETLIAEAEVQIEKAQKEKRTQGLEEARNFLNSAKQLANKYVDDACYRDIYCALVAVSTTQKPPSNLLVLLLTWIGVGTTVGVGAVIWYKKRNNNDEE